MKVNITLYDNLVSRIDRYADYNYMSRSGFVTLACTQFLNQYDIVNSWKDVAVAMRKIADTGKLDHETMEKLEDFERLAKMFIGQLLLKFRYK